MTDGGDQQRFAKGLAAIVLAGLALRVALRLFAGTDGYWADGYTQYAVLADSLASGHGYAFDRQPTAFRVPLYPMFIAGVTWGSRNVWALILAQAVVSSVTVLLSGLIARRLAGPLAGLAAAAVYAAWPYAAWHDTSLQESGLYAMLAALATWLLLRLRDGAGWKTALTAGAMLGLALLTRATLLPFALGAIVWLVLSRRPREALLAGMALLAVLAPWLERSHRLTGAWALGTESGSALYAGNHPQLFTVYPQGSVDQGRTCVYAALTLQDQAELAALSGNDAATSDWFRSKAIREIAANPLRFLKGAAIKLWAAFGPFPSPRHGTISNLGYAAVWTPFLLLALSGAWLRRRHWRDDALLYLHVATFCLTTALFWAQTSHRSYLDPYLAVLAGAALAALWGRIRARA